MLLFSIGMVFYFGTSPYFLALAIISFGSHEDIISDNTRVRSTDSGVIWNFFRRHVPAFLFITRCSIAVRSQSAVKYLVPYNTQPKYKEKPDERCKEKLIQTQEKRERRKQE